MNDSALGNSLGEIIEDLMEKQVGSNQSTNVQRILQNNPFRN